MGGRAGSGARGGGGGMSDSAIARMAKDRVNGLSLDPAKVPELLKGQVLVDVTHNYQTGETYALNARVPEIEARIHSVTDNSPQKPSTNSKAAKQKYAKAYEAYHEKYMAAMAKGVSEYKSAIGKTKNKELKALLAHKVVTYQGYMKEAGGVKDWIIKHYG